jgi:hypothetical protein
VTHFAAVAPLSGLRQLGRADLLGTYRLLIAPIVLTDPAGYKKFFREERDDQYVILDNGVIELGSPIEIEDIYKAARLVEAQLVVLPDVIDDFPGTIELTSKALSDFRKLDHVTDTMGVVQGRTFEECMECARALVDLGVDWLSPPRGLTKNLGTRVPLVRALASEFGLPMHVLGFSDNPADDLMAATAHRSVRGFDAATPMWLPKRLPEQPPTDSRPWGRRPATFWQDPLSVFAEVNISTVLRWSSDAQTAHTSEGALAGPMGDLTLDL